MYLERCSCKIHSFAQCGKPCEVTVNPPLVTLQNRQTGVFDLDAE